MIKWIKDKIIYLFFGGLILAGAILSFNTPPLGGEVEVIEVKATYFAEIDKDGIVLRVIVAGQEFINTGKVGNPNNWKQTYMDGSKRKNYAGKGYSYSDELDAFIGKKTNEDATFDEETALWILPIQEIIIDTTATTTND